MKQVAVRAAALVLVALAVLVWSAGPPAAQAQAPKKLLRKSVV